MTELFTPFYHLRVHTEYSRFGGMIRLDALLQRCQEYRMDAAAITDQVSLSGVPAFCQKARQKNIKALIGCEVYLAPRTIGDRTREDYQRLSSVVLLARTQEGYVNLCRMVTIAHTEGFGNPPCIDRNILAAHSEGLIGLSGCLHGEIARAILENRPEQANTEAQLYLRTLGSDNFYLEVQANGLAIQHEVNEALQDISQRLSIPLVATSDCYTLDPEDKKAFDVLQRLRTGDTSAGPGRKRPALKTADLHFKSPREITAALRKFPEAIANTGRIAARCQVEPDLQRCYFSWYSGIIRVSDDERFRQKALDGFEIMMARVTRQHPCTDRQAYQARINYEIKTIIHGGLSGWFLMAADVMAYARQNDIPAGLGRGAAAGSLVACALGLTGLNPLEQGLIFERFIHPEKPTRPEMVMDVCMENRHRMVQYITAHCGGPDYVSRIITRRKFNSGTAIQEAGRVLGIPLSELNALGAMIMRHDLPRSLTRMPDVQDFCRQTPEKARLLEIAQKLEGLSRAASTHAAALVVANQPLSHWLPFTRSEDGDMVMQFDEDACQRMGLMTCHLLGLRELTVMQSCIQRIRKQGKVPPDLHNLNLDDVRTLELIRNANTAGVYQLDFLKMKDLILKLQPESFSDLVAVLALSKHRSLESGMPEACIAAKHGHKTIGYRVDNRVDDLADVMEPVLKETWGIILYEEQIMMLAHVLAGYSMVDADDFRQAVCDGTGAATDAHRHKFIACAAKNGHDAKKATRLFSRLEKSGPCCTLKAHVAAYALITYQTAYLRAHHAQEFMQAWSMLGRDVTAVNQV